MELVHWVADCMDQGLLQGSGFSAELVDHSFLTPPLLPPQGCYCLRLPPATALQAAASENYESTIAFTRLDFKFIVAVELRDKFKCS